MQCCYPADPESGSGRLSNDIRSKQFIKIFKDENGEYESMVQRMYRGLKTADREYACIAVATIRTQVSELKNQLGEDVGISIEPDRRDTFPAIALACAYLMDVMHVESEEEALLSSRGSLCGG